MRGSFVDTLLARLDGAVAPIWVCVLLRLDEAPDATAMRAALRALVRESPRLRVGWRDEQRAWSPVERSDAEIDAALAIDAEPTDERAAIERVISAPIDLRRDLPLRLRLSRMADPERGAWLLGITLHHAIGDAKALGHLVERLWRLHPAFRAPPASEPDADAAGEPLDSRGLRDGDVLRAALRHPKALLHLGLPKYRLLARRGVGLRHSGTEVGAPILASVRFDIPSSKGSSAPSDIFLAAVLATAAAHARSDGRVRLRMPVDLRPALGLGRVLGNGCSAIPLELDRREILALRDDPPALARLARARLSELLAAGAQWTTALECLAVARLAPRELLRKGARPGLLAEPRTNTLVVTYLGSIDRHFAGAPLAIRSARTHTATWGVTGFCFRGALWVNVACFDGLWRRDELLRFTADLAAWTSAGFDLSHEVLA